MTQVRAAGSRQKGGGRLTPFGEAVREIRREKGILLIDMAHIAGVTPGFLSLVETGKKPIPERLVPAIVAGLDLSSETEKVLLDAAALSAKEYRIKLESGATQLDREVAHALQTGFAKMSPRKKAEILRLLQKD